MCFPRKILIQALASLVVVAAFAAAVRADEPEASGLSFTAVPSEGAVEFIPTDSERRVPALFRQEKHTFSFEAQFERRSGPVRVFRVRFPSPVATDSEANNTVHGDYFQPAGAGPFPGVVVLHELGGFFPLTQMIANSLARKGIAALFIKMPYYGQRRSRQTRRYMIMRDPELTAEAMIQGVGDIRRASAWLAARPEIDSGRLGLTGISLGGIMTALAAPVEPRFSSAAIIVAGGNLAETLWEHPHFIARGFREEWTKQGGTKQSFEKILRPVEPITYAELMKDRRVLIIAAKHDEIIPPSSTRALWEALDRKPELVWMDAGHVSSAQYLYGEIHRLARFFLSE